MFSCRIRPILSAQRPPALDKPGIHRNCQRASRLELVFPAREFDTPLLVRFGQDFKGRVQRCALRAHTWWPIANEIFGRFGEGLTQGRRGRGGDGCLN